MSAKGASLFRNILANMSGYLVAVLLSLGITPYVVRSLGDARYGAWSLVAELVGYYGMLDLGFRGAVTYYVARYGAMGEAGRVKRVVGSAFWTLVVMGVVVTVVGWGLTVVFPRLMDTEGLDVREAQVALFMMAVAAGLSLPAETCMSVLVGSMRLDLVNGIEVLNRLLMAGATIVVLEQGYGLIGLSTAFLALRILTWSLQVVAASRLLGGLPWAPRYFAMEEVKALASYGLRNSVTALAILLSWRTGSIITGMFLGVRWVAYYSIGSMMVSYAVTACQSVTRSFTPKFTALQANGETEALRNLFLTGARISGLLAVFLFASVVVFGTPFLRIWLGEQFVSGPWTGRSDVVMILLFLAQLPRLMQSISWQLLFATARVRFLMWLNLGEAACNIVVSLLLVQRFGIAGVALGVMIPFLVSHLIVLPAYVLREFSIPVSCYFRKGVGRPLIIGAGLIVIDAGLVHLHYPEGWTVFFGEAAVAAVVAGVVVLRYGLTSGERAELRGKLGWKARAEELP